MHRAEHKREYRNKDLTHEEIARAQLSKDRIASSTKDVWYACQSLIRAKTCQCPRRSSYHLSLEAQKPDYFVNSIEFIELRSTPIQSIALP